MSSPSNYYDCHDILSEETLVPATFKTGAVGIGRVLDPSSDTANLQRNSKTEIPYWMARNLAQRSMIQLRVPPCYSKRIREKVAAGAQFIDLRTACPYFYDLGMKINEIVWDETLPEFLNTAFKVRYAELLTRCQTHNPRNHDHELMALKLKLTVEEQQLFDSGCQGMAQVDNWRYDSRKELIGQKRKLHIGT